MVTMKKTDKNCFCYSVSSDKIRKAINEAREAKVTQNAAVDNTSDPEY